MSKRHPLLVPLLLSLCLLAGTAWAAWSGAPGYGGAMLVLIPLAVFARQVFVSRRGGATPPARD